MTHLGCQNWRVYWGYPTRPPHLTTLGGVKSHSWFTSQLQIPSLPETHPVHCPFLSGFPQPVSPTQVRFAHT